jgi:hypothetical protein
MVPVAFFCLWIASLQQNSEIEWRVFSLADLQKEKKPAIILCVPEMFWNATPPFFRKVDSELLNDVDTSQFVAYRYEYRYWTLTRNEVPPETRWIVDHGAGKEPTLILVSRDGKTKRLSGLFERHEIIDFLALERVDPIRQNMLVAFFVFSLLATFALIVWQRKKNSKTPDKLAFDHR